MSAEIAEQARAEAERQFQDHDAGAERSLHHWFIEGALWASAALTAAGPHIAAEVRSQREAFLPSDTLDPAWIAGWHAAIDHVAAHFARGEGS